MGAPIGVLAGTYLAEYSNRSWIGGTVRFVNDILLSAPSIVLGLFVYTLVVAAHWGTSRRWPARIALAFIVLPVVVRTTDEMLRLVPTQMREAALSLGMPQWKVIVQVLYRIVAGRHRYRHPAGAGAHLGRNRAAAVHRAQQPVLVAPTSCSPWPTCRW